MIATVPSRSAARRSMTAADFQAKMERLLMPSTTTDRPAVVAESPAPSRPPGTVVMQKPKRKKVNRPDLKIRTDGMGSLERVHKDEIQIDRSYQRDQNSTKVKTIARDWSYLAAGAVILARRGDDLYCIEGAHRVLASRLRDDIEYLNCIVFETEGQQDEATAFLITNTNRRPLTSIERFKAQIEAGDEAARLANQLLADADYRIVTKTAPETRTTKSVGAILRAIRLDRDVFLAVWPVILEVSAGGPIHSRVIETLFYIERRLVGTAVSLTRGVWHERIVKLGADTIVRETAAAAAYHHASGDAVWARGLVECMNRGMRSNRLVLPEEAGTAERVTRCVTAPRGHDQGVYETFANVGGNKVPPGVCCARCDKELTDAAHFVRRVDDQGEPEGRDYWCAGCNPGTTGG
jgi:hypothetical protein